MVSKLIKVLLVVIAVVGVFGRPGKEESITPLKELSLPLNHIIQEPHFNHTIEPLHNHTIPDNPTLQLSCNQTEPLDNLTIELLRNNTESLHNHTTEPENHTEPSHKHPIEPLLNHTIEQLQNSTIFQRVSVVGLVHLLSVSKHAEPHSCWCHDPNTPTTTPHIRPYTIPLITEPASSCPVLIPSRYFSKVLKKTCKFDLEHCCLLRGSSLQRSDLGPAWQKDMKVADKDDTTILSHLERLVDQLASFLTPEGQGVSSDLAYVKEPTSNANPLFNMDLSYLNLPPVKKTTKKVTKKPSKDSDLLSMFQAAAQYLLAEKLGMKKKSGSKGKQNQSSVLGGTNILSTVQELIANGSVTKIIGKMDMRMKRSAESEDSIGLTGLESIVELMANGTVSQLIGKIGQYLKSAELSENGKIDQYVKKSELSENSIDIAEENTGIKAVSKTDIIQNLFGDYSLAFGSKNERKGKERVKRSTEAGPETENSIDIGEIIRETVPHLNTDIIEALFEKGDFGVDYGLAYDQLGWFSKAVEAAMDGSLFIGIIVITLLAMGSLLSNILPFVTDTCLVCSLIGYANTLAEAQDSL